MLMKIPGTSVTVICQHKFIACRVQFNQLHTFDSAAMLRGVSTLTRGESAVPPLRSRGDLCRRCLLSCGFERCERGVSLPPTTRGESVPSLRGVEEPDFEPVG